MVRGRQPGRTFKNCVLVLLGPRRRSVHGADTCIISCATFQAALYKSTSIMQLDFEYRITEFTDVTPLRLKVLGLLFSSFPLAFGKVPSPDYEEDANFSGRPSNPL